MIHYKPRFKLWDESSRSATAVFEGVVPESGDLTQLISLWRVRINRLTDPVDERRPKGGSGYALGFREWRMKPELKWQVNTPGFVESRGAIGILPAIIALASSK